MKKIASIYQPYLLRPILQQMLFRVSAVAVVFLVCWQFGQWNENAMLWGDVSFLAALVLLAGAWFNYLRLDGLLHSLPVRRKNPKPRRTNSMGDYLDTDVVSYAELTDEERMVCRLFAYLIPGILLLLVSLVALFC